MSDENMDHLIQTPAMQRRRGRVIQSTILEYMSQTTSTDFQDIVDRFTQEEAFEKNLLQYSKKVNFSYPDYVSSLPAIHIRGAENLYFPPKNLNLSSSRLSSTSRTIFSPIVINDTEMGDNIVPSNQINERDSVLSMLLDSTDYSNTYSHPISQNNQNQYIHENDDGMTIEIVNNQAESHSSSETLINKAIETVPPLADNQQTITVYQSDGAEIIVVSGNEKVETCVKADDGHEGISTTSRSKSRFINNASFHSSTESEGSFHRRSRSVSKVNQRCPRQPYEIFCASQVTPYLIRKHSNKNLRRVLNNLGYFQHLYEKACTFNSFLEANGLERVQDYLNGVDRNYSIHKCSDCDFKSDMRIVLLQHRDKFKHYTEE